MRYRTLAGTLKSGDGKRNGPALHPCFVLRFQGIILWILCAFWSSTMKRLFVKGWNAPWPKEAMKLPRQRTATKAWSCSRNIDFDIVLTDLMMPGLDGFAVLDWIRENQPHIQVIVITGFATVTKAVTAMKQGAFDFVGKPFTPDYIRVVVDRAIDKLAMRAETERLREEKNMGLLAIDKSQSRLKTVFSCMAEAVVITDTEGIVVLHNPAAIKILEIQTDPFIGKHLAASIRDRTAINMINEAMNKAMVVTREFAPGAISRKYSAGLLFSGDERAGRGHRFGHHL